MGNNHGWCICDDCENAERKAGTLYRFRSSMEEGRNILQTLDASGCGLWACAYIEPSRNHARFYIVATDGSIELLTAPGAPYHGMATFERLRDLVSLTPDSLALLVATWETPA